jgi:hypothetical protein
MQTIVSFGLKYKTDFGGFGGEGYGISETLMAFDEVVPSSNRAELYSKVMRDNVLRLLRWF